jgi:MYXO-CTERM domain-containing protein
MVRRGLQLGGAALALLTGVASASAAPWDRPGWELTFQDEFDGTSVDETRWKKRYKWGEAIVNGELQAYVDDAFVVDAGVLSIVATEEPGQYAGRTLDYRSGVISSLHEQTYGYFEARVRVPKGKGYWPAFWLLGAVGTPNVNEIDVMEILGHEPAKAYMTVHWGSSYDAGHEADGSSTSGPDFSADFHTFGVEWSADEIRWSIDGTERFAHRGAGVPGVPMYLILNLAVGGNWPGAPDASTVFPGRYEIDYVRAYRRLEVDGGVAGSAGFAGSAGLPGTAGAGGGSGGSSQGGSSGAGASAAGSGGSPGSGSPASSSGCDCGATGKQPSRVGAAAALLLLLARVRRSRRRR